MGREDDVIVAFAKPSLKGGASTQPDLNADHRVLADAYLACIREDAGAPAVYSLGALYTFDRRTGLWNSRSLDAVAAEIGLRFSGYKLCRRGSDYKQIAGLVFSIAEDDAFFENAPAGIAAGGHFWRVANDGEIFKEAVTADHRQRFSVAAEPVFAKDPPLLSKLMDNAFGIGDSGDAQRELLRMGMGAALIGILWRHRVVLMLYGATSTGKSTILEVLRSFFPADRVGATNPQAWQNEYHAAALAGKSLNIVGELDPTTPLSGGIFKAVTGGDVIEGRHPTHRPFSFVCTAGHFFNCNRLPPTRDKSDAFFRRWRIIEFSNPVKAGQETVGLAEQINATEQSAVLGWLLAGAADLVKRGSLPDTEQHRRLIEGWRAANNSAMQFLLDREYVERSERTKGHEVKAQEVFVAYRKWANDVGLKPLGRNAFYEEVGAGGVRHDVMIREGSGGQQIITGVSLLK